MADLVFQGTGADRVFYYFQELTKIPHGSGNTKAISDYCMDFACAHDLDAQQDAFNNVIIRKPASPGREQDSSVLLQGHLDMVAVCEEGMDFDFMKESLRLKLEGDFLTAEGTTLGADDGFAVAMILAILEDESISTPALECVLTVDEEIGMLGALAMDLSEIESRIMFNVDCDVEGIITIGCAGGVRAHITLPLKREVQKGRKARLVINGLKGGHSGAEIHQNRVNGIYLMMEAVKELQEKADVCLIRLEGGSADNAIPASCNAEILIQGEGAEAAFNSIMEAKKAAIGSRDDGVCWSFTMEEVETEAMVWDKCPEILAGLLTLPNGVQAMSKEVEGLVETSLNLGICRTREEALVLDISVRSSKAEEKQKVVEEILRVVGGLGAETQLSGEYPGWPPLAQSPLQDLALATWEELNHVPMKKEAIHAGLECGVFAEAIPGIDIIAFGPDMIDIHSPRERLSMPSAVRCYQFTCRMLEQIH